jgi:hypothetical protein
MLRNTHHTVIIPVTGDPNRAKSITVKVVIVVFNSNSLTKLFLCLIITSGMVNHRHRLRYQLAPVITGSAGIHIQIYLVI